ncbi:MAG: hypothetical protein U1E76_27415 [Planctomycetota bacterium]
MIALIFSLIAAAADADDVPPAVQSDAAFAGYRWLVKHDRGYAPFVLVIGDLVDVNADEAAEVESTYGPALAAMRDSWRADWEEPAGIARLPADVALPIVLVPDWEQYRTLFWAKHGNDQDVPAAFALDQSVVTYHRRQKYQSTLARRKAILDAAAVEMLLSAAGPARDRIPAWLVLGLAAQLSDGEGGEIPLWRQDLAAVESVLDHQPTFESSFCSGSLADLERAANRATDAYQRSYLRLFGYSLLTFVRSAAGARHQRGFLRYLREEYAGKGGWQGFRTCCQEAATLEQGWREFSRWQAQEPLAAAPPQPAAPATSAAPHMPFEVLDFAPESMVELRAEVIRRVRAGAFAQAQSLLVDDTVAAKVSAREELLRDRRLLEDVAQLYPRFARSLKTGDMLPTGVGLTGKVTAMNERTFDLEVKKLVVTHPWTDLALLGVARRVFPDLQFFDAGPAAQAIEACVLAGERTQARIFLGQLPAKGIKNADVSRLEGLLREFDAALEEADAREAIDDALKKEAALVLTPILKLAHSPSIVKTAAFKRARPFLRRLAAEVEMRKFKVADVFHGKCKAAKGDAVTLQYAFAKAAELDDWQRQATGVLGNVLGLAASGAVAAGLGEGDALVLAPGALLVHRAAWVGDVTFELTATQLSACDESRERQLCQFFAGCCVPGTGRLFAARHFSEAVSDAQGQLRSLSPPLAWLAGTDYRVTIMRRGDQWSLQRASQQNGALDENLGSVSPLLACAGTSSYRIKDVTITGHLDPVWLYQARQARVDELMQGIFGE